MNLSSGWTPASLAVNFGFVVAATNACAYPDARVVQRAHAISMVARAPSTNEVAAVAIPEAGGALRSTIDEAVDVGSYENAAFKRVAQSAARDAKRALSDPRLANGAYVYVTDEGVLVLEWGSGNEGVLLVFSGQNEATISVKTAGCFGATAEFTPSYGLPSDAGATIRSLKLA